MIIYAKLPIRTDLHPLAIEDVLHQRQKARSKADYYPQHLFIRLLRHTLAPESEETLLHELEHSTAPLPRSSSPKSINDEHSHKEHDEKTLVGSGSPKGKYTTSYFVSKSQDLEKGKSVWRPLLSSGSLLVSHLAYCCEIPADRPIASQAHC